MEVYQRLLTTCKPEMNISGSEGLVEGIKDFLGKIIEKVVQAAKWFWNVLTGGGNNNQSVSDLSKGIDKEVKKAEQTVRELARAEEKLYGEIKTELNKETAKDVFKQLEKIDLNKPNTFGDYVLDDGRTARQASDDMLLQVLGKERFNSYKKNVNEKLTKASDGSISPAKVKTEGLKIAVAAATGKPLPKKTSKTLTGVGELKSNALWCFRSKAVCDEAKKHPDAPVPVDLVNKSVVETFGNVKAVYNFLTESLNKIELLSDSDRENITKEKLVSLATDSFNHIKDKEFPIWDEETQHYLGHLDSDKKGISGLWCRKESGTPSYPGKVSVDLTTFEIINQQIKEIDQVTEKTKHAVKRVNSWLFEISKAHKAERDKNNGEVKESREAGEYFMLIYGHFNSFNILVMKLNNYIRAVGKYASTPLEHLN